jgi:hypothetical protein
MFGWLRRVPHGGHQLMHIGTKLTKTGLTGVASLRHKQLQSRDK